MNFGTLEFLAIILISLASIKLIILLIHPNLWFGLLENIYSKPQVVSSLAFALALLVLFFIIQSGVTVIEILAVCLFVALLIATGIANFADDFIVWAKRQDSLFILKELFKF